MTERFTLSLSEVEALALKAARGAGLAWGLAEEAAFATRWLCENGAQGLDLLAQLLHDLPPNIVGRPPTIQGRDWSSGEADNLCPIAAGAALCDHSLLAEGPLRAAIKLCRLPTPALILPFAAMAAMQSGTALLVEWPGCSVIVASGARHAVVGGDAMMTYQPVDVWITAIASVPQMLGRSACMTVSGANKESLDALVHRTYVPASEQSRRGAGAVASDDA